MNNTAYVLFLLPLFALMTPFIIWPIEQLFPYPYIVEEVAKGIFIFFVLSLPHRKTQLLYAILIGLLFSLSENVLYIFNIINVGTVSFLLERLFLTIALHIGTMLVMFIVALRNRRLVPLGVQVAGIAHYLFNSWVLSL